MQLAATRLHDRLDQAGAASAAGPAPEASPARPCRRPCPARVHTDLLAAGLIADPYLDDNETAARLDRPHRLGVPDHVRLARRRRTTGSTWSSTAWTRSPTVTLNGVVVGAHRATMHRGYRFDVARAAARGRQHARGARSPSPLRRTPRRERDALGARPGAYPEPLPVHPQDGLQLRLGLGPDAGHRRASGGRSACTLAGARLAAVRPLVDASTVTHGRVEVARRRRAAPARRRRPLR